MNTSSPAYSLLKNSENFDPKIIKHIWIKARKSVCFLAYTVRKILSINLCVSVSVCGEGVGQL